MGRRSERGGLPAPLGGICRPVRGALHIGGRPHHSQHRDTSAGTRPEPNFGGTTLDRRRIRTGVRRSAAGRWDAGRPLRAQACTVARVAGVRRGFGVGRVGRVAGAADRRTGHHGVGRRVDHAGYLVDSDQHVSCGRACQGHSHVGGCTGHRDYRGSGGVRPAAGALLVGFSPAHQPAAHPSHLPGDNAARTRYAQRGQAERRRARRRAVVRRAGPAAVCLYRSACARLDRRPRSRRRAWHPARVLCVRSLGAARAATDARPRALQRCPFQRGQRFSDSGVLRHGRDGVRPEPVPAVRARLHATAGGSTAAAAGNHEYVCQPRERTIW